MGHILLPKFLYKYRHPDKRTLNLLRNGEIYFSSISQLNDPFEGSIPYVIDIKNLTYNDVFRKLYPFFKQRRPMIDNNRISQYIGDVYRNKENLTEYSVDHINETNISIDKSFGIFCLTTEKNNFLMWSHYSNSHKGICIGFNSGILYDAIGNYIGKVEYKKELPKFEINDDAFYHKLLWTKSDVWGYENEYRFIKFKSSQKKLKIPLECISDIIFGCNVDNKWKIKALKIISRKIPSARIFESELSRTKFEITYKQIK